MLAVRFTSLENGIPEFRDIEGWPLGWPGGPIRLRQMTKYRICCRRPIAPKRRIALAAVSVCLVILAVGSALAETVRPQPSNCTATIVIDLAATAEAATLPPELFGINAN